MGRSHRVLIESIDEDFSYGYTENYIKVKVDSRNRYTNKLIKVKPVSEANNFIKGKLL